MVTKINIENVSLIGKLIIINQVELYNSIIQT